MTIQQLAGAVEAVMFANGDSIEIKRLCEIFDVKNAEIEKALNIIENRFNREDSGIRFLRLDKNFVDAAEKLAAGCSATIIQALNKKR